MGSSQIMIRIALLSSWFYISSTLDLNIINYHHNGSVERLRSEVEMRWLYEEWMVRFDKSHMDMERERRFEIFKDNLRFIDEHNRPSNNHSYTVGLNGFADLTNEEYQEKYLNKLISVRVNVSLGVGDEYVVVRDKNEELGQLPASVDWRSTGAVGPVIDQGECGSLIALSAQQLVDCEGGFRACVGGHVDSALDYIVKNRGIDTLESYPYKKAIGRCKQNAVIHLTLAAVVSIDSRKSVFSHDEKGLQRAVAGQPVGIAIEAKGRSFQLYKGGIFNGPCGTSIDHAMLLIGYGAENGQDYWLIKNTYGVFWGENGFVRMERNIASRSGRCGITEYSSYYPYRRQGP
ncbi:hypothetical protein Taro_039033 [Colocasia esculenta]|uniref:Uncharacterized protein n=1 Tax=Colocasia esculenta TaxID=4460 RepID=A0A843WL00_COLES|nr:hypothetical protein [Colocasia esculenta]